MLDKAEGVVRVGDFRGEIGNSQVTQKEQNLWQTNACWANQEQWAEARDKLALLNFFLSYVIK